MAITLTREALRALMRSAAAMPASALDSDQTLDSLADMAELMSWHQAPAKPAPAVIIPPPAVPISQLSNGGASKACYGGRRLAELMQQHDLNAVELAQLSGASASSINKFCRGCTRRLKPRTVARIASALGIDPSELTRRRAAILRTDTT